MVTSHTVNRQHLDVFQRRVTDTQRSIFTLHENRASALRVVSARVKMIDGIVRDAWSLFVSGDSESSLCLVAVGGYGRGELNPHSDIDIMLLMSEHSRKSSEELGKPFIRFLWDIGLEVGHSMRTVREALRLARDDITIMTNLLESRFCCGNNTLYQSLEYELSITKIWPVRKFYEYKLAEQHLRHQKYSDTAFNLEPNIKESPGGLRDIHMIVWVATRYFGVLSLHNLVDHEFIDENEYRTLIRGRNHLWKIRNSLHFMLQRREDRLLLPHQLQLAKKPDSPPENVHAEVAKFMKHHFRTIKELHHVNTMLLQHFDETILARPKVRIKPIDRNFHSVNGFVELSKPELIRKNPEILLDTFRVLQTHPELKGIRASTSRLIRSNVHLINHSNRNSEPITSRLLDIFTDGTRLPDVLERMHQTGLLGNVIPDFGKIVGQMQYDLVHIYTVDAHSLIVVRNLHEQSQPNYKNKYPLVHSVMKRIVKPERLYIAGLFHDIAKGQGGDHSELGERKSYAFCKRIGMSEYDAHFVAWLVRHHLLLSFTSQREDMNDAQVVSRLATKIGDQEHLDNLYALTVADIRGTSPTIWNEWKGKMLEHAYISCARALLVDSPTSENIEVRMNEICSDAQSIIGTRKHHQQASASFWEKLPKDYFLCYDASTIAWHAKNICAAGATDLPLVRSRKHPSLNLVQSFIVTPASEELFAVIAGAFDHFNINIVEARIHPLNTGLTAFCFVVLPRDNSKYALQRSVDHLNEQIRFMIVNRNLEHRPRTVTQNRVSRHVSFPTSVTFTQSPTNTYTMMEVSAQDRPGLLYLVARTLLDCKVNVLSAKITTYGERAEDVFFIVDRDDNAFTDLTEMQRLKNAVVQALEPTQPVTHEMLTLELTGS